MDPTSPSTPLPEGIEQDLSQQIDFALRNGRLGRFNRIRERAVYSSYLFAPGINGVIRAGKYEVFKAVRGSTGQGYASGLTSRETNWLNPGAVPDEQNMLIKSIHVDIVRPTADTTVYPAAVLPADGVNGHTDLRVPVHPSDVTAILQGALLGMTYLTNTVPLGKLADFPAVGGAHGRIQAGRQTPVSAGVSGTPQGVNNRAYLPVTRNAVPAAFERRAQVRQLLRAKETFSMAILLPQDIQLMAEAPVRGPAGENGDVTGALEVRVSLWVVETFIRGN